MYAVQNSVYMLVLNSNLAPRNIISSHVPLDSSWNPPSLW
jgi:hypothetical protein